MKLEDKYPLAFEEVKTNPIYNLWGQLSDEYKEETLKGITKNMEYKGVKR